MDARSVVFTVAFAAALAFFVRRVYLLSGMVLLGQAENRYERLHERLKSLLVYGFGQKRVVEEAFGVNHFLLFWGFILLQVAVNVEFILNGIFPAFSLRFIGEAAYAFLNRVADVTSLIVLLVVITALVRRAFFRPWWIEAKPGSFLILALVGLLMVSDIGLHVSALAGHELPGHHFPLSRMLLTHPAGLPDSIARPLGTLSWWLHAAVLLAFICYIPYSKHLHILTALVNCFFRRMTFPASLPPMVFRPGETFGVSKITQLTWKDLYDFLSCTECGRCARTCPATDTGKVLNPMHVVLAGKANMELNGMELLRQRSFDSFERADTKASVPLPLIGEVEHACVRPEAIWDCTTCGACVEKCPVFIEQFPKLLKMRRHLVMEKVEFPPELITLFENIEARSNPYGIAPSERAAWSAGMDVPPVSNVRDAEYLLFAGCVASFNARMRSVLAAVVAILRKAGIPFAILGKEERCCGDPMRRLGNEYIFDRMARANVEQFNRLGVRKIITICPHCFNSLHNDYPAFGGRFEVYHHSQVISRLLATGALTTAPGGGRVVIHDACYLGRYNGIYEEPRQIVKASSGAPALEMERTRRESFCCGAGGGRLWMHESRGTRINTARTRQALATGPSIVATSCPYCLSMFEDGLKDEHAQSAVRAMDIAELLNGALRT